MVTQGRRTGLGFLDEIGTQNFLVRLPSQRVES